MDNVGSVVMTVATSWTQSQPSFLTGLGCLKAFNLQPLIDPGVHSVVQPFRCLPLCNPITAELNKLLDTGIIEPVNDSPNLAVAKKKNGDPHVWTDL